MKISINIKLKYTKQIFTTNESNRVQQRFQKNIIIFLSQKNSVIILMSLKEFYKTFNKIPMKIITLLNR